jgi:hypothetical protein
LRENKQLTKWVQVPMRNTNQNLNERLRIPLGEEILAQKEQEFPHVVTHPHHFGSDRWVRMRAWLDDEIGVGQHTLTRSSQMRFRTVDQAVQFSLTWC